MLEFPPLGKFHKITLTKARQRHENCRRSCLSGPWRAMQQLKMTRQSTTNGLLLRGVQVPAGQVTWLVGDLIPKIWSV